MGVLLAAQAVCFALHQWLQYRQVGSWHDYPYGEVYVTPSLVATSLFA